MIATYKVLSAVLSYPTAPLQAASHQLVVAINAERLLPPAQRAAVGDLIARIAADDLLEAQSHYVDLFDRTRALSLHLFEHVYGESRDRGQAMVSLLERYRQAGLDIGAREFPDYIPLFLEFLSTLPEAEARSNLGQAAHIFVALGERLRKRGSDYAIVLEALAELSRAVPNEEVLDELRRQRIEDPADLGALDKAWEEAEVRFGPGDVGTGSCPRADEMIERMMAGETAAQRQGGLP